MIQKLSFYVFQWGISSFEFQSMNFDSQLIFISFAGPFQPPQRRGRVEDLEAGSPARLRVLAGGRPLARGLRGRRQPQCRPASAHLSGSSFAQKNKSARSR